MMPNMLTMKEVSEKIGYSYTYTTILIKKYKQELADHVFKIGNLIVLDAEGVKILISNLRYIKVKVNS